MTKLSLTVAAVVSLAFAGHAYADPADAIISKNKCHSCHTATTTKKGPSWASVAQKLKGDAGAEAKIVEFLKTGGANEHLTPKASDDELKAIAAKVLASK
jgi:cytochrome c